MTDLPPDVREALEGFIENEMAAVEELQAIDPTYEPSEDAVWAERFRALLARYPQEKEATSEP